MRLGVHGQQELVWLRRLITVMFRVTLSIQIDRIVEIIAIMDYLGMIFAELAPLHLIKLALDQIARP